LKTELLILFPVSIACDVAGQVFFKLGAGRMPEIGHRTLPAFLSCLARDRWLMAGLLTFAVETLIWLRILAEVPLSIAFPIASLNFIGVTLASRLLFDEPVSGLQWAGCILVTAGVAILAAASAG
jgi:undecaprenyl phosphate-alpha-L-ara4N flippase subunit ArnE